MLRHQVALHLLFVGLHKLRRIDTLTEPRHDGHGDGKAVCTDKSISTFAVVPEIAHILHYGADGVVLVFYPFRLVAVKRQLTCKQLPSSHVDGAEEFHRHRARQDDGIVLFAVV